MSLALVKMCLWKCLGMNLSVLEKAMSSMLDTRAMNVCERVAGSYLKGQFKCTCLLDLQKYPAAEKHFTICYTYVCVYACVYIYIYIY